MARRWLSSRGFVAVACAIVSLQLFVVLGAFAGARWWFSWGPNDYLFQYRIAVDVGHRSLGDRAIQQRYHVDPHGIYENPIDGLFGLIRTYETRYARAQHATVSVTYQLDGGTQTVWRFRTQ